MKKSTSLAPTVVVEKDNELNAAVCPKCKGRHGYIAIIKTTVTGRWESCGISIERLQKALAKGLLTVNAKCADCGGLINNSFPLAATQDTKSGVSPAVSVDTVASSLQPSPKSESSVSCSEIAAKEWFRETRAVVESNRHRTGGSFADAAIASIEAAEHKLAAIISKHFAVYDVLLERLRAANLIIDVSTSADPGVALRQVQNYVESSGLAKEAASLREEVAKLQRENGATKSEN